MYVYAGVVALLATIVTFAILYYRWKRTRPDYDSFRFSQLATDDDDPAAMKARMGGGGGGNPFGQAGGHGYGSL